MKRKITYIHVEDNYLAQEELKILIKPYDNLECIGICNSAFEAKDVLNQVKPDLIFLDIEMPYMSGMDLLPLIDTSIKIIVTSCSREYAVNSFLYNVVDYLNKPIFPDRIAITISKINKQIEMEESLEKITTSNSQSYILVKGMFFDKKIYTSDIIVCKSNGNEVIITRDDIQDFKFKGSLKKLSEQIDSNEFVRINKSIVISISKIKHIFKKHIELTDNNIYFLTDEFSDDFNKKLFIFKTNKFKPSAN